MFGIAQNGLLLILAVAALAVEAYALIDSMTYSNETYYAAGKRNKAFWLAMTGSAAAVGFLTLPPPLGRSGGGPLSLIGFVAFIIACVYLADVRHALRSNGRPPKRGTRGGW